VFYHIVLMSFAPGCGPDFFKRAEAYVERVKTECDGVVSYLMRENLATRSDGLTHGIIGVFTSSSAHDAYQVSPVHQEMKGFMTTGMSRIVVLDLDQGT
jgi:hypothetical protein